MSNLFKILADKIDDFVEDCKEPEFVVFEKVNMTNGRWNEFTCTKKQLLEFMKEHETCEMKVFRIEDEVKIIKEFSIELKEDD